MKLKKYRFDYIKEWVDKWNERIPKDKNSISSVPFNITFPSFDPGENGTLIYTPSFDYYGETIDDIDEWMRQRNEFCEKLANEYKHTKINERRRKRNFIGRILLKIAIWRESIMERKRR